MLSVGRQFNLEGKVILCRKCLWQGSNALLQTGLVPITNSKIHVYAYRCPECGSFNLGLQGKLLNFKLKNRPEDGEEQSSVEDALFNDNGNIEKKHSR
jgi:hypothetical protein